MWSNDRKTILRTERLILRPFEETDGESLYKYAKDPDIGPMAGWNPHRSVEESREIIRTVLSSKEDYALCLREDNIAIGSIGLKLKGETDMTDRDDECELGFWIGKPFWGNGYVPEAAGEIIRHGFMELKMNTIWCGYYDGNVKSKRAQEKIGFKYFRTRNDVEVPLLDEIRVEHINIMTREMWEKEVR